MMSCDVVVELTSHGAPTSRALGFESTPCATVQNHVAPTIESPGARSLTKQNPYASVSTESQTSKSLPTKIVASYVLLIGFGTLNPSIRTRTSELVRVNSGLGNNGTMICAAG